jgi:hypothetical protein
MLILDTELVNVDALSSLATVGSIMKYSNRTQVFFAFGALFSICWLVAACSKGRNCTAANGGNGGDGTGGSAGAASEPQAASGEFRALSYNVAGLPESI